MQEQRPIANPIVVLREEFDDWAVLFNPDMSEAVGVNPVGVTIWKLLDGHHTVHDVAQILREEYSNPPEEVEADVAAFINDLAAGGFVGYKVSALGE